MQLRDTRCRRCESAVDHAFKAVQSVLVAAIVPKPGYRCYVLYIRLATTYSRRLTHLDIVVRSGFFDLPRAFRFYRVGLPSLLGLLVLLDLREDGLFVLRPRELALSGLSALLGSGAASGLRRALSAGIVFCGVHVESALTQGVVFWIDVLW